MIEDLYCSQLSQAAGEQLFGTAVSGIKAWFLLEYNRPWAAKATEDNELSEAVQSWLREGLARAGNGRLQFIRQHKTSGTHTFFIALPEDGRLYRFDLDNYEALFTLDVAEIVAGAAQYEPFLWHQPLYLVCTHGKRDRCCALWGAGYYRAMQPVVGTAVWQTTHLGGHRFAATMLTLPDGVMHGRLLAEEAAAFVQSHQQGHMQLDVYRGRCQYEPIVQAADYFLRREVGETAVTDFRYLWHEADRVQFSHQNGAVYEVEVGVETAVPDNLLASCGKPQTKAIPQYSFVSCTKG
jgi:hypothetical protein